MRRSNGYNEDSQIHIALHGTYHRDCVRLHMTLVQLYIRVRKRGQREQKKRE